MPLILNYRQGINRETSSSLLIETFGERGIDRRIVVPHKSNGQLFSIEHIEPWLLQKHFKIISRVLEAMIMQKRARECR